MSIPVVRTDPTLIQGDHEKRIAGLEQSGFDPTAWIYVGSGAPAPAFQNGFSNVGGNRVPMRYRFLRPADPALDTYASPLLNPNSIEIQGAVTGGSLGSTIFQLLVPRYLPDGTPDWQTVNRDKDVHLAACDSVGAFVCMTVLQSGAVVYGFV